MSAARRCLVVGYDRTESARGAARWAAEEVSPDGRLVIVHASRPLHAPNSPLSTPEERRSLARALIEELLLESEDAMFDVDITAEISDSDPVSALTRAATENEAHAIVIGSESHSALHRALGTVTTELLRSSPVAVIAVPAQAALAKTRSESTRG